MREVGEFDDICKWIYPKYVKMFVKILQIVRQYQKKTASLLTAMIAGRAAWGVTCMLVYSLIGMNFGWQIFIGGALLNAIPGIIVQIVLIPVLVHVLEKVQWVNQWVTE